MKKPVRELTEQEKRSICKLVTQKCANYYEDYGCLPLECNCVMLEKVYCGNAMCRYFREFVLPNDPELNAAMQNLPAKRCKQCGKLFPARVSRYTAVKAAQQRPGNSKPQREYADTDTETEKLLCNDLTSKSGCVTSTFLTQIRTGVSLHQKCRITVLCVT